MPDVSLSTEGVWSELRANIRGFVGRRVRQPADVDDIVQRVFLQVHRALPTLRDADRLHAWIYQTTRRAIADYYRAPSHTREVPAGAAVDLAPQIADVTDGRRRRDRIAGTQRLFEASHQQPGTCRPGGPATRRVRGRHPSGGRRAAWSLGVRDEEPRATCTTAPPNGAGRVLPNRARPAWRRHQLRSAHRSVRHLPGTF